MNHSRTHFKLIGMLTLLLTLLTTNPCEATHEVGRAPYKLVEALRTDDLSRVKAIISKNPEVLSNKQPLFDPILDPIVQAIEFGSTKSFKYLISHPSAVIRNDHLSIAMEMLIAKSCLGHPHFDMMLTTLIQHPGVNINKRKWGQMFTPLMLAIQYKSDTIVAELLKHPGLDVNRQVHFTLGDKHKIATALTLAIKMGNEPLAIYLINRKDLDVNAGALAAAIKYKNPNIINALLYREDLRFTADHIKAIEIGGEELKKGSLVDRLLSHPGVTIGDLLAVSIRDKREGLIDKLLSHPKLDVNEGNPLVTSIMEGREDITDRLLSHKAIDVNNASCSKYSPLLAAIQVRDKSTINKLLKHKKIDVNQNNASCGFTPLTLAIYLDNFDVAMYLLKNPKIDVNKQPTLSKATALHHAILKQSVSSKDIIDVLLASPTTNVNLQDANGDTPLHLAVRLSRKSARLIFDRDKEVTSIIQDSCTMLLFKRLLSRSGIDISLKNKEGNTPLHLAIIPQFNWDSSEEAYSLLESTLDINIQNKDGYTPLHLACKKGDNALVTAILRHKGVDVLKQSIDGKDALQIAEARGLSADIVEMLRPIRLAQMATKLEKPFEFIPK